MTIKKLLTFSFFLGFFIGFASVVFAAEPDFDKHPAQATWDGVTRKIAIVDDVLYEFRTRILAGAKKAPNFAGRYRIVLWGCGSGCVSGAMVDLNSGRASSLRHTVCCFLPDIGDQEPVEFRLNSRVVVFRGMIDEEPPMGEHIFVLRGERLRKLGDAR